MKIENLNSFERDTVLRYLLHAMPLSTRQSMMAEFPVMYARMVPHAASSVLNNATDAVMRVAATYGESH